MCLFETAPQAFCFGVREYVVLGKGLASEGMVTTPPETLNSSWSAALKAGAATDLVRNDDRRFAFDGDDHINSPTATAAAPRTP